MFDEGRWQQIHSQVAFILQPPGVTSWWASGQIPGVLSPEFVALVEEILGEEPGRGDEVGHVSVGAS